MPHFNVPLRVYHTLLLLDDVKAVLKTLPADSSPQLLKLVHAANPFRSFQELQKDIDCTLAQIFRMAAHLVYWGKGKIIDHVTQRNVYVVSKDANLDINSDSAVEFGKVFPEHNLADILSSFSYPKPLESHLPNNPGNRSPFLDILVWLLRKGYLCQLHEYIYLVPYTPLSRERPSERLLSRSFSKATDSELEAIEQLTQGHPVGPANLFKRLYPYFNGAYYKEEIIWREGISRSDLAQVLTQFKNELVVCIHE